MLLILLSAGVRVQDADGGGLSIDDRQRLRGLLAAKPANAARREKIRRITDLLLGSPYIVRPLSGSPVQAERLVGRLDGFDCVTFVETVLSLSRSRNEDQYLSALRHLRYLNGEVGYHTRLHYLTDWHNANVARGELYDLTRGALTVQRTKDLTVVEEIPPHVASIRYFPKSRLSLVKGMIRDGDLIYFITSRAGIDTSHCGLLFWQGENLVIRHASRSHQSVIEADLDHFFATTPMLGFILARPAD